MDENGGVYRCRKQNSICLPISPHCFLSSRSPLQTPLPLHSETSTEGKFSPCISVYSYPRKENLPDLEEQSVMKSIKEVEKKTRSRPGIYNALQFGITSLVKLVELNNESTLCYSKGGGG